MEMEKVSISCVFYTRANFAITSGSPESFENLFVSSLFAFLSVPAHLHCIAEVKGI